MVFTVEIDDKGKTGKSILQLLKDLSKTNDDIHFIKTVEDDELVAKIDKSLKSGRVSRQTIDKTLATIIGK